MKFPDPSGLLQRLVSLLEEQKTQGIVKGIPITVTTTPVTILGPFRSVSIANDGPSPVYRSINDGDPLLLQPNDVSEVIDVRPIISKITLWTDSGVASVRIDTKL
jgi:hypothetical protein